MIDPLDYTGLAAGIARDFAWRGRGHGFDLDDLCQEGMLSVLNAIRKWADGHPGKPMPPGYTAAWIRNSLRNPTRSRPRTVIATDDLDTLAGDQAEPDTAAVEPLLALLSGREADVLVLRLGLDGNHGRSAVETGKVLGLWPSRVQVIEKQALANLRKALAGHAAQNPHTPPASDRPARP